MGRYDYRKVPWRGRFYCRHEGEYSQWHLKESGTERESSGLSVASRMDQAMRGEELGAEWGGGQKERVKRELRESRTEIAGLYRNEKGSSWAREV